MKLANETETGKKEPADIPAGSIVIYSLPLLLRDLNLRSPSPGEAN